LMKRYMRELGKSIGKPVAYLAVPERRTSGCGFHPIPLHWHFLAACPSHRTTDFLRNARQLWTSGSGNASVSRYDPSRSGAYYVAKLAADQDFDFSSDHLDRLSYHGPNTTVVDSGSLQLLWAAVLRRALWRSDFRVGSVSYCGPTTV
jgi:hypothetical protein